MRTQHYSDFLANVSALIGVELGDLETTELTFLNTYFNKAIRKIWEANNWTDLCPYGEVRFPVNLVSFPNDLTQTGSGNWSLTNVTTTATALANPLDNRVTASQVLETSATGQHGFTQSFSVIPNTNYMASGYARFGGRSNIQVTLNDGVTSYSSFYNLGTGVAGTASGSGASSGIQMQANGFYYWSLQAKSASTAMSAGTLTINLSPDGSSTSYSGSVTSGIYSWGVTLGTPNSLIPAAYYVPWEQPGEKEIDVVFSVWTSDPGSFLPPYLADYSTTPNGIELIGPTSTGPVYLYYRTRRPLYIGSNYSSSTSYSASSTFYYTSTTTGYSDYYTVGPAGSTAGQTPDANPGLFSVIAIPYVFFEYAVYNAYADWLEVEGQTAKANSMRGTADTFLTDETDRLERQQGQIMPWRVYTHLTSQNRGLGYVGQNFNAGTATIN